MAFSNLNQNKQKRKDKKTFSNLHEIEGGPLPDGSVLNLVVEAGQELDAGQRAAERSLEHLFEREKFFLYYL